MDGTSKLITVKIPRKEYKELKCLSRETNQFLQFHLTQAIRQYLAGKRVKP